MKTLNCEQCGQPFLVRAYRESSAKFCSQECYGKHQSISRLGHGRKRVFVSCFTCGKEIEKRPSDVKGHNFCSRGCFAEWRKSPDWSGENNPSWLGGHTDYRGANWYEQSQAARERDKNTCQECGLSAPSLHVHHKVPFHLFDDYRKANELGNLITLCPVCHKQADLEFWASSPETMQLRGIPKFNIKSCKVCGADFEPLAAKTNTCDNCTQLTCVHCGKQFKTRRVSHRKVKYCSRDCRNAHIKASPA